MAAARLQLAYSTYQVNIACRNTKFVVTGRAISRHGGHKCAGGRDSALTLVRELSVPHTPRWGRGR